MEEVEALKRAFDEAKTKRMELTVGNIFSLCEPGLRAKLMRAYTGQLHLNVTGIGFERIGKDSRKEEMP